MKIWNNYRLLYFEDFFFAKHELTTKTFKNQVTSLHIQILASIYWPGLEILYNRRQLIWIPNKNKLTSRIQCFENGRLHNLSSFINNTKIECLFIQQHMRTTHTSDTYYWLEENKFMNYKL